MSDLSNLKAGDKVLSRNSARWFGTIYKVATIDKVTPTGIIKCGGEQFRPDGERKGDPYGGHTLIPFDQSILDRQQATREHQDRARGLGATDWQNTDAAIVLKVCALLAEAKVGVEGEGL